MSLASQISLMTVPQEFSRLCNAILRAEHGDDFLPIDDDRADAGNDGYLASERRMFAMHCFKRPQNQGVDQLIRRKMIGDLGKAIALEQAGEWRVGAWTFVSNYPVSERLAAELVRMGREQGISVSWMGPAELAIKLHAHPEVLEQFPGLHASKVSTHLEGLRDSVSKIAREVVPESTEVGGVPHSPRQLSALLAQKPRAWEYLLFAGALLQGREALEFTYLDHKLGIAANRRAVGFDEALEVIQRAFERLSETMDPLERAFQEDPQRHAFGPPGEPGDAQAIQHLAHLVVHAYEELLDIAGSLDAIAPPKLLVLIHELTLCKVDEPLEALRAFITKVVEEMDRLPDRLGHEEHIVIDLELDVTPDETIGNRISAESRRIGRKVRWLRPLGLDVDRPM